eukprot:8026579-Alexandrium_andersonii.AAC.1
MCIRDRVERCFSHALRIYIAYVYAVSVCRVALGKAGLPCGHVGTAAASMYVVGLCSYEEAAGPFSAT